MTGIRHNRCSGAFEAWGAWGGLSTAIKPCATSTRVLVNGSSERNVAPMTASVSHDRAPWLVRDERGSATSAINTRSAPAVRTISGRM